MSNVNSMRRVVSSTTDATSGSPFNAKGWGLYFAKARKAISFKFQKEVRALTMILFGARTGCASTTSARYNVAFITLTLEVLLSWSLGPDGGIRQDAEASKAFTRKGCVVQVPTPGTH